MAQATETRVPMNDLNLLPNDYIAKDWKEGKHSRKGRLAVHHEKRYMVDLQSIGKIAHSSTSFISMSDYNDLVTSVNKLRRELIDVTFDTAWLREEEIADHGDIVGHVCSWIVRDARLLRR